jgi:dUTP pyrophosphatase
MPQVKVFRTTDLALPKYETDGAAGMDLQAAEDTTVLAGFVVPVPTRLFVEIPKGYEIQIRPRSGLSAKTALRVANAPGTIDHDYRGEIKVLMWNTSMVPVTINKGDRIAQMVLQEVPIIQWKEVSSLEELSKTDRGGKGFGSTG